MNKRNHFGFVYDFLYVILSLYIASFFIWSVWFFVINMLLHVAIPNFDYEKYSVTFGFLNKVLLYIDFFLFIIFINLCFVYFYKMRNIYSLVSFIRKNSKVKDFIRNNKESIFKLNLWGDYSLDVSDHKIRWIVISNKVSYYRGGGCIDLKVSKFNAYSKDCMSEEHYLIREKFIAEINSSNRLPFKLNKFYLFFALLYLFNDGYEEKVKIIKVKLKETKKENNFDFCIPDFFK